MLRFRFEAKVLHWRGPAPFYFAPVPGNHASEIRRASRLLTYGWGMIPVEAAIGSVGFRTSLFPKDETYLLPIKADVRRRTGITAGDTVSVEMTVEPARR